MFKLYIHIILLSSKTKPSHTIVLFLFYNLLVSRVYIKVTNSIKFSKNWDYIMASKAKGIHDYGKNLRA